MTRAGTSQPFYFCPWCLHRTYHDQDILHRYCHCCGSDADPTLFKTCPHRVGETIRDLVDRGVTLVRRDPWGPFNYLEIEAIAGFINPFGTIHQGGSDRRDPAITPLYQLPRAGWEPYTGPTVDTRQKDDDGA